MENCSNYTNVTFSHNFSQHVQISCLKNQHAKNQIACFNASFTITLGKDKVKVSHAKVNHIFACNKNASTEPHNYPMNLSFSVNKNSVCSSHAIFFLMLATILHKIQHFEKKIKKNTNMSFFFEQDLNILNTIWKTVLTKIKITK